MQILVKGMFARVLFASLLTVVFSVVAAAQSAAEVDAVVQKMIDAKGIPAAGVVVVRDGKAVLVKGYGPADIEAGTPVNENTVFQIASVTKQFTAAGILLLVEEGKLKLDDTLGKYISDVPAKWSGVTIRQLLNQTSGIPNYTEGGKLVLDKSYTQAEILALVKDVPPAYEAGARWSYSNTNYFLLGMIIEKVSGKSYPEFMSERIFKPLGMTSTMINTSGLKSKNAASGYMLASGKWQKSNLAAPKQPYAEGASVSMPADIAKCAIDISEGELEKKTSWDEAWTPGKLSDGKATTYGFGWQMGKIGEASFVGHSGGIPGFSSFITRFPNDNLSVVVLTNTAGRAPEELALEIAGLYLPKVAAGLAAVKAAKNVAAIPDTDPSTTKFLRGVFEGMVKGEGDPALFSPEMQKVLFPDNIKQLKGPLGSQGPIKAFELLTAENTEGNKRRIYRATFESGVKVRANFFVDAEGKIAGASVRPE